jgi:DNA polymerase-3 subunit delta'
VTYPWLKPVETEFLDRLEGGRLPHALLLSGPRDTGKQELAGAIMASLLCLEDSYPACGRCRSCALFSTGAHPDGRVVTFQEHPRTGELRKEIVIGQVRNLIASLYLTNTISKRKAAMIHPAEAMNINTSNALLKTLEEPPGDTVIVLVSHDPMRLPPTIRSRCQNLHVRVPHAEIALQWLCAQGSYEQDDAAIALQAAAGRPLAARAMLETDSTEQYRLVIDTLASLHNAGVEPPGAMQALGEVEPSLLWSWLSLHTAQLLKEQPADAGQVKALSILQSGADKNRALLPTPVRKDLLLQDWLIQWSRLKA